MYDDKELDLKILVVKAALATKYIGKCLNFDFSLPLTNYIGSLKKLYVLDFTAGSFFKLTYSNSQKHPYSKYICITRNTGKYAC